MRPRGTFIISQRCCGGSREESYPLADIILTSSMLAASLQNSFAPMYIAEISTGLASAVPSCALANASVSSPSFLCAQSPSQGHPNKPFLNKAPLRIFKDGGLFCNLSWPEAHYVPRLASNLWQSSCLSHLCVRIADSS